MMAAFAAIAVICTFLTFFMTYLSTRNQLADQEKASAFQLLNALDSNLFLMVSHIEEGTNMLFLNQSVQDILRAPTPDDAPGWDIKTQALIVDNLTSLMFSDDRICSVALCDEYGNVYSCTRTTIAPNDHFDVTKMPWYKAAIQKDGDFLFVMDAGVVKHSSGHDRVLSIIRVVKDRLDYKNLGILIVNVDENAVRDLFSNIGGTSKARFAVWNGKTFFFRSEGFGRLNPDISQALLHQNQVIKTIGQAGGKVLNAGIRSSAEHWCIIGVFPQKDVSLWAIIGNSLILIFSVLLFLMLCGVYATYVISAPLKRIEMHLHIKQDGIPVPMPIDPRKNDEITEIQTAYNEMQQSIVGLIKKVQDKEKQNVKNKVALIQAQLQPHFLYNTLGAISALALEANNAEVYQITQALGNFYKTSLNNGNDFVSLGDEINCIQSYMTILNIRYDNQIIMHYDIPEELNRELVPKLILQPCVENAFQHGIRVKGGKGNIHIQCTADNDCLILSVRDDGAGMSKDKLETVMRDIENNASFGFGSIARRVSLLYEIDKPLTIKSTENCGTEVIVRILRKGGAFLP
jgi:Predicted signal transduction protein with a C-terminal ATPase domain